MELDPGFSHYDIPSGSFGANLKRLTCQPESRSTNFSPITNYVVGSDRFIMLRFAGPYLKGVARWSNGWPNLVNSSF